MRLKSRLRLGDLQFECCHRTFDLDHRESLQITKPKTLLAARYLGVKKDPSRHLPAATSLSGRLTRVCNVMSDGARPVRTRSVPVPRLQDSLLPGSVPYRAPEPETDAADQPSDLSTLTPLRAHYLKRELVTRQLTGELFELATPDALSLLGPPFASKPRTPGSSSSSSNEAEVDIPFLRFFFRHFVLTFPFLAKTQPSFFKDKLQPFVHSFLSRNISSTDERDEDTKRRRIAGKIEKHLGLILSSAIKLSENDGKEEVVRVAEPREPGKPRSASPHHREKVFDVNVVTVRNVVNKGRVRKKVHEEFIIRVRRKGQQDVHVSRRYRDFMQLAESVR
jgi:hypothetical protein